MCSKTVTSALPCARMLKIFAIAHVRLIQIKSLLQLLLLQRFLSLPQPSLLPPQRHAAAYRE